MSHNWTDAVLNISKTVDAGIDLIHKASRDGASIITFPELWFPGQVDDQIMLRLFYTMG